ncbi:unnamed protein product [Calypogeia fissa]
MVGYALSALPQKPAWLAALLNEKFFVACAKHVTLKKNERNIFCVDCSDSICQHCHPTHRTHRLLQIRRYVYHDVIRLLDVQKLVDCSQVQTYIINSARVVFLNQRPQPRPSKGLGNACETCERSLQETYRYCSVACKVDAFINQGKDLIHLLPRCTGSWIETCSPSESLKSVKLDLEDEMSPTSVLSDPPTRSSSDSSGTEGVVGCGTVTSTATTLPPPKKHRSSRPSAMVSSPKTVILPSSYNRRKCTPHRSPFC